MRGTPGFLPPEILGLNGEDPKNASSFPVDIWCLGETVFQALVGHGTFESVGKLSEYVSGSIGFPRIALKEANVSDDCIGFICSLMSPVPSQRLSATQALDQPWMSSGEEAKLGTANCPAQEHSRLEQLELRGDDEISQASGERTGERVTKAAGDSGQNGNETTTSMEHDGSAADSSVYSNTRWSPIHQASVPSEDKANTSPSWWMPTRKSLGPQVGGPKRPPLGILFQTCPSSANSLRLYP